MDRYNRHNYYEEEANRMRGTVQYLSADEAYPVDVLQQNYIDPMVLYGEPRDNNDMGAQDPYGDEEDAAGLHDEINQANSHVYGPDSIDRRVLYINDEDRDAPGSPDATYIEYTNGPDYFDPIPIDPRLRDDTTAAAAPIAPVGSVAFLAPAAPAARAVALSPAASPAPAASAARAVALGPVGRAAPAARVAPAAPAAVPVAPASAAPPAPPAPVAIPAAPNGQLAFGLGHVSTWAPPAAPAPAPAPITATGPAPAVIAPSLHLPLVPFAAPRHPYPDPDPVRGAAGFHRNPCNRCGKTFSRIDETRRHLRFSHYVDYYPRGEVPQEAGRLQARADAP